VHTYGTGRVDEDRLGGVLREMVRLTPRSIRERLDLLRPIYARTAAYGHFGRPPESDGAFSWERTDLADQLARHFGAAIAAE
jgi:S-adenosylmethionine synthetase